MYPYYQKTFCKNKMVKGKRKHQRQQVSQQKWRSGRKKDHPRFIQQEREPRSLDSKARDLGHGSRANCRPLYSSPNLLYSLTEETEVWRLCLVHSKLQAGDKKKHKMPPKLYMTFWWPQSDKKARILKEDLHLNHSTPVCNLSLPLACNHSFCSKAGLESLPLQKQLLIPNYLRTFTKGLQEYRILMAITQAMAG